jgi:hypothetical protein
MATVDYYHRYNKDGSCESICTRCFATLGPAIDLAELKLMEAGHSCPARLSPGKPDVHLPVAESIEKSNYSQPRLDRLWYFLGRLETTQTILLCFSIILCFYLLPTVIEFEMMKHVGVWVACILFGDTAGCIFLSLGLGLRKTGALLYTLLTVCEAWLYVARIVPPHMLAWIVDLGPTLTIMGLIAFRFFSSRVDRAF